MCYLSVTLLQVDTMCLSNMTAGPTTPTKPTTPGPAGVTTQEIATAKETGTGQEKTEPAGVTTVKPAEETGTVNPHPVTTGAGTDSTGTPAVETSNGETVSTSTVSTTPTVKAEGDWLCPARIGLLLERPTGGNCVLEK